MDAFLFSLTLTSVHQALLKDFRFLSVHCAGLNSSYIVSRFLGPARCPSVTLPSLCHPYNAIFFFPILILQGQTFHICMHVNEFSLVPNLLSVLFIAARLVSSKFSPVCSVSIGGGMCSDVLLKTGYPLVSATSEVESGDL